MKIGEVCLMTENVVRLADFYKKLFRIDNQSNDPVHQFIITEETSLTIFNDGIRRIGNEQSIYLAFTVDDVDVEYTRLLDMGIEIATPPTMRPWGAKNMSFLDPDNHVITFRSFPK